MAHETKYGIVPDHQRPDERPARGLPKDAEEKLDAYTEQAEASSPEGTSTGRGTAAWAIEALGATQALGISPVWGLG